MDTYNVLKYVAFGIITYFIINFLRNSNSNQENKNDIIILIIIVFVIYLIIENFNSYMNDKPNIFNCQKENFSSSFNELTGAIKKVEDAMEIGKEQVEDAMGKVEEQVKDVINTIKIPNISDFTFHFSDLDNDLAKIKNIFYYLDNIELLKNILILYIKYSYKIYYENITERKNIFNYIKCFINKLKCNLKNNTYINDIILLILDINIKLNFKKKNENGEIIFISEINSRLGSTYQQEISDYIKSINPCCDEESNSSFSFITSDCSCSTDSTTVAPVIRKSKIKSATTTAASTTAEPTTIAPIGTVAPKTRSPTTVAPKVRETTTAAPTTRAPRFSSFIDNVKNNLEDNFEDIINNFDNKFDQDTLYNIKNMTQNNLEFKNIIGTIIKNVDSNKILSLFNFDNLNSEDMEYFKEILNYYIYNIYNLSKKIGLDKLPYDEFLNKFECIVKKLICWLIKKKFINNDIVQDSLKLIKTILNLKFSIKIDKDNYNIINNKFNIYQYIQNYYGYSELKVKNDVNLFINKLLNNNCCKDISLDLDELLTGDCSCINDNNVNSEYENYSDSDSNWNSENYSDSDSNWNSENYSDSDSNLNSENYSDSDSNWDSENYSDNTMTNNKNDIYNEKTEIKKIVDEKINAILESEKIKAETAKESARIEAELKIRRETDKCLAETDAKIQQIRLEAEEQTSDSKMKLRMNQQKMDNINLQLDKLKRLSKLQSTSDDSKIRLLQSRIELLEKELDDARAKQITFVSEGSNKVVAHGSSDIERGDMRHQKGVMLNEMTYNDYNTLPLNENMGNYEYDYGYTFMPPANWYPTPPNPPLCVSNKTCDVCPILTDGTTTELKKWNSSRRITPPDNINTKYIKEKLNSGR